MNIQQIQAKINKISGASFSTKTDRQLKAYEAQSVKMKKKYGDKQPPQLHPFRDRAKRNTKLTLEMVRDIRSKYEPFLYGILKLAQEYGVSKAQIRRILNHEVWRE